MSAIDCVKHTLIGIANCPSRFELVYLNDTHREIPLYRLDEDLPETGSELSGKRGDLLLGGGSGESAAFRVAVPEAIRLFTSDRENDGFAADRSRYYRAFWDYSQAFVFGDGYQRLGWNPRTDLPNWLAENVVAYVLREYPDLYGGHAGKERLEVDGFFIRKPADDDFLGWGGR